MVSEADQDRWHAMLPVEVQELIFDELCTLISSKITPMPYYANYLLVCCEIDPALKTTGMLTQGTASWNAGIKQALYRNNDIHILVWSAPDSYAAWALQRYLRDCPFPPRTEKPNYVPLWDDSYSEDEYEPINDLLAVAAESNLITCVSLLLDHGACVNAAGDSISLSNDDMRSTMLGAAAWHGNIEMAKMLIAAGAPLHSYPEDHPGQYEPPLVVAVLRRQCEIVRLLLEAGAQAEITFPFDFQGYNVTCYNYRRADLWEMSVQPPHDGKLIEVLVDCGLGYGFRGEYKGCEEIEFHYWDVSRGRDERHPFALAAMNGNEPAVKVLLERGVVSREEARRLTVSIEEGHHDFSKSLIRYSVEDMRALLVKLGVFDD